MSYKWSWALMQARTETERDCMMRVEGDSRNERNGNVPESKSVNNCSLIPILFVFLI